MARMRKVAPEAIECLLCDGTAEFIGALGNRAHYKCRSCGGMCSLLVGV